MNTRHDAKTQCLYPRLVEFNYSLDPADNVGAKHDVVCNLNIGLLEFEEDELTVGLSRCEILFVCDGFDFDPNYQFGAVLRTSKSLKKNDLVENVDKRTRSLKVGTDASIDVAATPVLAGKVSLGGEASLANETKRSTRTEIQSDEEQHYVEYQGGNSWVVQEVSAGKSLHTILKGKYLNADKLCSLVRRDRANRNSVNGWIVVRQKDLEFHFDQGERKKWPFLSGHNKNKQRVLELLMAQSLHQEVFQGAGVEVYQGNIVLSYGEVRDEF